MNRQLRASSGTDAKTKTRRAFWGPLFILVFGAAMVGRAVTYHGPLTDILYNGKNNAAPMTGWLMLIAGTLLISAGALALFSGKIRG
ncbi:MAG: hypothetical protein ABIQ12_02535 [Opitutaceae bacterium]